MSIIQTISPFTDAFSIEISKFRFPIHGGIYPQIQVIRPWLSIKATMATWGPSILKTSIIYIYIYYIIWANIYIYIHKHTYIIYHISYIYNYNHLWNICIYIYPFEDGFPSTISTISILKWILKCLISQNLEGLEARTNPAPKWLLHFGLLQHQLVGLHRGGQEAAASTCAKGAGPRHGEGARNSDSILGTHMRTMVLVNLPTRLGDKLWFNFGQMLVNIWYMKHMGKSDKNQILLSSYFGLTNQIQDTQRCFYRYWHSAKLSPLGWLEPRPSQEDCAGSGFPQRAVSENGVFFSKVLILTWKINHKNLGGIPFSGQTHIMKSLFKYLHMAICIRGLSSHFQTDQQKFHWWLSGKQQTCYKCLIGMFQRQRKQQ